MRNLKKFLALITAAAALPASSLQVSAATATGSFQPSITIQANCAVVSTNAMGFGNQGVLTSNIDVSATFAVQCTNSTAYNVGLDAGTTSGGTTSTRLMTDGSSHTVQYKMYQDVGHTTNWGNTVGTDTVAGTGNGASQTLTVYGRVIAQTTPQAGTYNDTVTVTITY